MNNLMQSIANAGTNISLSAKKNSPAILFGVGACTFVGAIVSACAATVKAIDVAEEHKNAVDEIKAAAEDVDNLSDEEKKQVSKVYLHTALSMAKLYAPTAILATTSLGTMFASNKILRERNASLAAAYTAVSAAYKKYRNAVVEKYGEEIDYKLAHGIHDEEIEETYVDSKGKEKTRKVKAQVVDKDSEGLYTRYFVKSNSYWQQTDDLNEFEFRTRENLLNDCLYIKKFVTLNDALELFGFQKTDYGMVCGWRYDEKNPSGDNRIIVRREKSRILNEFGEYEECWILDFNCDGNIYDYMINNKTGGIK